MKRTIGNQTMLVLLSLVIVFTAACGMFEAPPPAATSTSIPTSIPVAIPTVEPVPTATTERVEPLKLTTTYEDETRSDPPIVLSRRYPELEGPQEITTPFNELAKARVDKEMEIFLDGLKDWTSFPDMPDVPHTFLSGYSVYSASQKIISLKLEFSTYVTGAAHPYSFVRTVNYDLVEGRELFLKDIFKPGSDYLGFLSEYCRKELSRNLGEVLFEEGLAPTGENFRSWGLVSDGLVVEFDPYQVAAYAAGPQQVQVPYEAIEGLMVEGSLDSWKKFDAIIVEAREAPPQWPEQQQVQ